MSNLEIEAKTDPGPSVPYFTLDLTNLPRLIFPPTIPLAALEGPLGG